MIREKGKDMSQSCDKISYINRKFKLESQGALVAHPSTKSFNIIAMHLVCCCRLPVWKFWKKRAPLSWPIFALLWVHYLGRYGRITLTHVYSHEHFIPNKFRKYPFSGSVVKADYVFPYIYMH